MATEIMYGADARAAASAAGVKSWQYVTEWPIVAPEEKEARDGK